MTDLKKQTKPELTPLMKQAELLYSKPKQGKIEKNTPESIAVTLNTYAEIITRALNRPDCKPDDPENFYYDRVRPLKRCRKNLKALGIDLLDVPTLTGTDYKRGTIDFIEWIEYAIETVNNGGEKPKVSAQGKPETKKKYPKMGSGTEPTERLMIVSVAVQWYKIGGRKIYRLLKDGELTCWPSAKGITRIDTNELKTFATLRNYDERIALTK